MQRTQQGPVSESRLCLVSVSLPTLAGEPTTALGPLLTGMNDR